MWGPVTASDLVWLKPAVHDKEPEEINLGKNRVQMEEGLQTPAKEFRFDSSGTDISRNPMGVSGKVEHRLQVKSS